MHRSKPQYHFVSIATPNNLIPDKEQWMQISGINGGQPTR